MKKEDIDEATNSIKSLLGNNVDDNTSNLISDMLTNIKDELQKEDMSSGNPLDSIVKIAESVASKIKPKIEEDGIDMTQLWNSTQTLANQCKDQNGNDLFGGNMNPFELVNQMMGGLDNQNPQGMQPNMTQEEYLNNCNEMLQSMGMRNIDFNNLPSQPPPQITPEMFQMLNQMVPRSANIGKKKGGKKKKK